MKKRSYLRILKIVAKIIAGLIILGLIGLGILFDFFAPQWDIKDFSGEAADIEKTGPDGTKYTINNGMATFGLDVAKPDKHCGKIFRDYKAALEYCRDSGLPLIPSVHLVQGKLKQFDDGLCAALEAALQQGLPGDERLSKAAALSALLDEVLKLLARTPEEKREAVESAAVHLASALSLGGNEPRLGSDMADKVRKEKLAFLSEPAGFWTWNEQLRAMFMQDHYLSRGFDISEKLPVCIVLAAVISQDKKTLRSFCTVQGI